MLARSTITLNVLALFLAASGANATIIENHTDASEWQAAVGRHATIDFTDLSNGTPVTTQYASQGVIFTNFVSIQQGDFWSDGFGLLGMDGIRFQFDQPHHAIAVDYLGAVTIALYSRGMHVGTSWIFSNIGIEPTFAGIISDVAFDEVYLFKPFPPFSNNVVSIDTLYWGMPIPAPSAVALLTFGAMAARRRQRS